jgi:mannan endo-1,4-beta-mannosidase
LTGASWNPTRTWLKPPTHKGTASARLWQCASALLTLVMLPIMTSRLEGSGPKPPQLPPGFVGRVGTSFVMDGKTFNVAGVNNHYLTFGSNSEVIRVLDDAVAMHANVIRTFIQPVIGSLDDTTVPTIWNRRSRAVSSDLGTNGIYMLYWDTKTEGMAINNGPNGLQRLDFLLAEARKRNLKLLIAFLDFWSYTGGAQQMRAWYGSKDERTFFAQDPRTVRDYKQWIRHVLTRVNSITGIAYADDTTVFAWELMNEPDLRPATLLRTWIAEISAFVKEIDPRHLVATGHANLYDRFSDLEIATIDFGTWHGYPIYFRMTPEVLNNKIAEFCGIGRKYGKPMVWEEFGWARSNPGYVDVYRKWLDTVYNNEDCAGWLVWRLVSLQDNGQYPRDQHDQFDVHNDDGPLWQTLKAEALSLQHRSSTLP